MDRDKEQHCCQGAVGDGSGSSGAASLEPGERTKYVASFPEEDGKDGEAEDSVEVEEDGAVRGAGDEPEESGAQFCGEKEKEDDVGPRIWHFRCFSRSCGVRVGGF